jgi:hypothetical protein
MRRIKLLVLVAFASGVCCGCAGFRAPVIPPHGIIFTKYSAPLTVPVSKTPATGGKVGKASTIYVGFYLDVATGDASIQAAAKEGGISKIYYADYEIVEVLGIFWQFTIKVYGE